MQYKRPITFAVLSLLITFAAQASEPSLEQVLERYYDAIGGRGKLAAITAMRLEGHRIEDKVNPPYDRIPLSVTLQEARRVRLEVTVQDKTGVQAYDGETAWTVWPFTGSDRPSRLSEEATLELRAAYDLVSPLFDAEHKGHRVTLSEPQGEKVLDDPLHLLVTLSSGQVHDYYLDSSTYLPLYMSSRHSVLGSAAEALITFEDYRRVDGVLIAHRTSAEVQSEGQQRRVVTQFETVELNPSISKELFSMPALAEEARP